MVAVFILKMYGKCNAGQSFDSQWDLAILRCPEWQIPAHGRDGSFGEAV